MSTYVLMKILESVPRRYDRGIKILTQTITYAVKGLSELVEEAGFLIESRRFSRLGSFMEIVARRPEE